MLLCNGTRAVTPLDLQEITAVPSESAQETLESLAAEAGALLQDRGWLLVTAESCTGGWIAQAITSIAGSSQWFDRGLVTYSNEAKRDLLGVQETTLLHAGAVSEATVAEMARGALQKSRADISAAVTGIAGPGGGVPGKPVGTVWFGWATRQGDLQTHTQLFSGQRAEIRAAAAATALQGILRIASGG